MAIPDFLRTLRASAGHQLLWLPGVTAIVFDDAGRVLLNRRTDTRKWSVLGGIHGGRTFLGVPLMLGPHVIGVLFAADRRARVFEREQIALLGSFAALAAAAIDTANLLNLQYLLGPGRSGTRQRDHPGPQRRHRTRLRGARPARRTRSESAPQRGMTAKWTAEAISTALSAVCLETSAAVVA
ncbi:hypothetical protein SGLAM104S_03540 [Streptomyces glaucescens]